MVTTLVAGVLVAACSRGHQYELRGQVLAVDPVRGELTIKHEDIKGFMPGMTMPFKVSQPSVMTGIVAGDLVRATLLVEDTRGYLTAVTRTGTAPLTEAPPRPYVEPLTPGTEVPDIDFVDDTGASRHLADWRGRALAVTFIYTRCPLPDFCPHMDRQFAGTQELVSADDDLRGRVQLLSVSFDPSYDTPPVLATHAKKVGADPGTWMFLTGDAADIESFAARFGVSVMREGSDPGNVVHNLRTAVIDSNGRLVKILNGMQWAPSELVTELRSALAKK
jgi:protein SCO1/2